MRKIIAAHLGQFLFLLSCGLSMPMISFAAELGAVLSFSASSFDNTLSTIAKHKKLFDRLPGVSACINNSSDEAPCAYLYASPAKKEFILELCQDAGNSKKGLYHLEKDKQAKYYTWFNPQFMEWACVENSSPGNKSEYWGIRSGPKGRLKSVIYSFYINQSAGFYYIKLNTDGSSKVLDEAVDDLT